MIKNINFTEKKLLFKKSLAPFENSKGVGFINKAFEKVIKPHFRDIGYGPLNKGFVEGLCKASYRRRYGFINKDGEFVIPPSGFFFLRKQ